MCLAFPDFDDLTFFRKKYVKDIKIYVFSLKNLLFLGFKPEPTGTESR
jgi:hypothetical protein